jgi:hypothetical protein
MRIVRGRVCCLLGAMLLSVGIGKALAQDSFASINTVYFEIKYQSSVAEADVRKLADYLQEERKAITRKLGFDFNRKIEVRVYGSVGKFLAETGLKLPWRGAYYQRGMLHVQPLQALTQRKIFEPTLSFELSAAILEGAREKGCPQWLREAFAVYQSGELKNLTPPIGAKLASFADLNQDIQVYPNPPQRGDVHYMLGQTMIFLVQRFGDQRAFGVFKQFDGNSSIETIFKKHFGEDYLTIEKAWAKSMAAQTSPFRK